LNDNSINNGKVLLQLNAEKEDSEPGNANSQLIGEKNQFYSN
jgi:hypothetical protein